MWYHQQIYFTITQICLDLNLEIPSILSKAIYRFKAIPTNIPMAFFSGLENSILTFIWNLKRSKMAQKKKKPKLEVSHFLISKGITKLHKSKQYQHKGKQMKQNRKARRLETNPHIYSQMIFNKVSKTIQQEKDSSQQLMLGKLYIHMQERKTGWILTLHSRQKLTQNGERFKFKMQNYKNIG